MASMVSVSTYTGTAKTLHWLIVVLLTVQFVVAWAMPHIGPNTRPETLINLHFMLGVVILFFACLRLLWRLNHAEPAPEAGVPPWQTMTATVVHWLLYLLLFVIPILGWANRVGYIGGTTVGVGNNGFYWKSIESGQLLQLSQLCCLRQRRRKEGKGGKAARMYAKAAST